VLPSPPVRQRSKQLQEHLAKLQDKVRLYYFITRLVLHSCKRNMGVFRFWKGVAEVRG
jgi:hypothetical protein